ncbi:MAG TPA: hypothetical protein VJP02_05570 [Candidatus Sulfotelmatobacter sp.]|nr:hypothetical protein [Candidatus Sulfotelmatobacter sp.]
MPRRLGQIVARGRQRWLIRVFLGRDRETHRRRYHNRTVHGTARRAQEYLTKMLRERDLGRGLEGSEITLNEFLDRWLETAAKPKLREKSYRSYNGLLGGTFDQHLAKESCPPSHPSMSRPRVSSLSIAVCRLELSGIRIRFCAPPCVKRFAGGYCFRIRPGARSCRDSDDARCEC